MENKLLSHFGNSWYEALGDYLKSPEFLFIGRQITELRKTKTIYPESELVFRAFRDTPFDKTNIVLLGSSPLNDKYACGHSYCNCESLKITPKLKDIIKEINEEYPETINDTNLDRMDLNYLCKQGIFLLNVSLTTEKLRTHTKLWKPFIVKVIETLNQYEELIYIMLDEEVYDYEQYINPKHICLKGKVGIFRRCNYYLDKQSKLEINW